MISFTRQLQASESRTSGNVLLLSLVVVMMLGFLVSAVVTIQNANLRQSDNFLQRSHLRKYAEDGLALAVHDIRHGVYEAKDFGGRGSDPHTPGNVGTDTWSAFTDYGRDGMSQTNDEGEGDGIPTPGEPGVTPQPIGPSASGTRFVTHTFPTGFANLLRVVSTASRGDTIVTVEHVVEKHVPTIPRVAAMYVDPNVTLDLKGNTFKVNGNDHDPYGNPAAGDSLHGIATDEGENPGDNQAALLSQIDPAYYDQIDGLDGPPSIGETTGVEMDEIYGALRDISTQTIEPGTYDSLDTLGSWDAGDLRVSYVEGDLHLSGELEGSGVLVINGSLTLSGQLDYRGLVVVRGDVRLTGGGQSIHIYGGLMVGTSLTAIDSDPTDATISGNADVVYSSEVMDQVQLLLAQRPNYHPILYKEH